jgi:hypothetical protein
MPPEKRVLGQKSARSTNEDHEEPAPSKKFAHLNLVDDSDQKSKYLIKLQETTNARWFEVESDPQIHQLRDFNYIWRTYFGPNESNEVI